MTARAWTITINNYTKEDEVPFINKPASVRYCIAGYEVGDEGTPHLQAYVEMYSPCRLSAMKKLFPRAHLEIRRGTRLEAKAYCMKDGIYVECGDWEAGGQGQRPDLDKARQFAVEGGMRLVTQVCSAQQIKVAEKFLEYNESCRDWKPEVHWIWGPTGVGKSYKAREILDNNDVYTKNTGTKWWTHYDGHENVIIDDFRDSWWSLTETLALLDRYEFIVECKGGARQFLGKKIVVTSCKHPSECYKGVGEDIQQLIRRIDNIWYMDQPYTPDDNVTKLDDCDRVCHEVKLDTIGDPEADKSTIPVTGSCHKVCHEVGGVILEPPQFVVAGALRSPSIESDIIYEDNIYQDDESDEDDDVITFDGFYNKYGWMPI